MTLNLFDSQLFDSVTFDVFPQTGTRDLYTQVTCDVVEKVPESWSAVTNGTDPDPDMAVVNPA
jgi:hypothetical protein